LLERSPEGRFPGQFPRDFLTVLNVEVFKASGVVVGRKCPDNNARPYAPVGRIGRKSTISYIIILEMEPGRHKIKPTGRPVKAIKREVRACIRFTRPEYLIIKEKAGKVGLNMQSSFKRLSIPASNRAGTSSYPWPRIASLASNFSNLLVYSC
jgi:hypothetical protein